MSKTQTKDENKFKLYFTLTKNGEMGRFCREWAKEVKRSVNTIKMHWIGNRELPATVTESQKDWAIKYLQNAIKNQD